MKSYRRMTVEDRCQISAWMQVKLPYAEMAKRLGFHKSTIYRELKRNSGPRSYNFALAETMRRHRFERCRRKQKIIGSLQELIIKRIKDDWSAVQISERLLNERDLSISHECIYRYLRPRKSLFRKHLRRLKRRAGVGRYLQRQGTPHQFTPNISVRPDVVGSRGRVGDWERDIMFAKNKTPILVCVERKTRFIRIARVKNLKADTVNAATLTLLRNYKTHTITNDRGAEFKIPLKEIKTYYCDPQAPQQRGTVENTIGLVRQYIQRDTEEKLITPNRLRSIENKLNYRPRKVLDFKTPYEVLNRTTVALAT